MLLCSLSLRPRSSLLALAVVAALALGSAPSVEAQTARQNIEIAAQDLGSALDALAAQTGIRLLYSPDAVKGRQAPIVRGKLSVAEALSRLLAGSGLGWSMNGDAYAIRPTAGGTTMMSEMLVTASALGAYGASAATVGGKVPLKLREIPHSVSVLTREQMDDQNMATTWDALSQVTGVQAISNDSLQGQYQVRGTLPDIRYDGAPSQFPLGGNQQFDLAMYERVEVQRGPTGVLQGSGSFGGVVNLVRKRPKDTFSLEAMGALGSWSNKRLELDVTGPVNEAKNVRGRFVVSKTDRDWFVDRYHDDKSMVYAALDMDLNPATTLMLSVAHQEDESPGYSGLPTYTNGKLLNVSRSFNPLPTWNQIKWNSTEYSAALEHRFENRWVGRVQLTRREATDFFHDAYLTTGIDPATNTATYRRRQITDDFLADDFDAYLSGPFDLFGRTHSLLVGANYSRYQDVYKKVPANNVTTLDVSNVVFTDPPNLPDFTAAYTVGSDSVTWQRGLYSQVRLSLADPLTLVIGTRSSDYSATSRGVAPSAETGWSPGASTRNHLTPSAGVIYDVTRKVSVYGSYADIFVPQTAKQYDGKVLDPRVGKQYELGTKGEFFDGRLNASVALFDIRDTNRSYADPAHPGFYLPLGEVESKGWEVEAAGSLTRNWDVSAGYTNLITRNTVNSNAALVGAPISYWYPRHLVKLWSNYRFSGALAGFNFGFGMQGQSHTASGTSTATVQAREQGGFAVFSAQVGYRIDKTYSLTLTVSNLFDRTYFTRIQGVNSYMTYGEPRNVVLAVRAKY